jgi:TupA-like ATPgrasp
MGWGLRGRTHKALERAADALLPESAYIAFHGSLRHKRYFGTYPNLIRPKTFSEKLLHRMLFDRRTILTRLQDKYAVREYVDRRIGGHILPVVYWVTTNPADIPFDDLPDRFVVKATHGCGWTLLVPDKSRIDRREVIDTCLTWLGTNYWNTHHGLREWAYKYIEPRIMVEQLIDDGTGPAPTDYKFHTFSGRVHLIEVLTGRFVDLRDVHYTPSWDRLDTLKKGKTIEGPVPRPPHLDQMLAYAERLGDRLDYVRVDFYDADRVYFGEMTLHPHGGLQFLDPRWNRRFGELWDLRAARNGSPAVKEGRVRMTV